MIGLAEREQRAKKVVGLIATPVVKIKKPDAKPALHAVEVPEKKGQSTPPVDRPLQHVAKKAIMAKNQKQEKKDE